MTARRAPSPVPALPNDGALFRTIAGGDLGALGVLFDRHHSRVRAFLARAVTSGDVDDLVQETFLAAARAADTYDGRDDARPFLIAVAANLAFRRRRSFARLRAMLTRLGTAPPEARAATPDELLVQRGDAEAVRAAVAGLSEDRRLALLMVEWEGLSGDEAARSLGVPVGTLYRRLHEARAEIGRKLRRDERRDG